MALWPSGLLHGMRQASQDAEFYLHGVDGPELRPMPSQLHFVEHDNPWGHHLRRTLTSEFVRGSDQHSMWAIGQVLFCAALVFEGVGFDTSPSGLFGLFGSWTYLWKSLYLGTIPGVVGIVSFTAVLKWLHPLVVALPGNSLPRVPKSSLICVILIRKAIALHCVAERMFRMENNAKNHALFVSMQAPWSRLLAPC